MFVLDICIDCRSSEHKIVGVLLKCGAEGSEWSLFPSSLSQLGLSYKKSLFSEINFSSTTGGLRQKPVLTTAPFIRPSEMPSPRPLNTSGRGEGSWVGTCCEQTLEMSREKPPWICASMECQHVQTAFSKDSSTPTFVTRCTFCYPSFPYQEGKKPIINSCGFLRCQSLTEEGRCQSQLPRLWTARSAFSLFRPKEIPRTGSLLGGYDYIINKEADKAEVVNKHFVRKFSQCTQIR